MRALLMALTLLAICLPAGLPAAGEEEPGGTFFDDDGNLHEGTIEAIARARITRGCAEPDLYCPGARVTRGQMAAFLVRAFSLLPSRSDPFGDDDETVFAADIAALAAAGVTRGCAPSFFCPERAVSRGELAAFLTRAMGLERGEGDPFVDDDGSVFERDIAAVAAAGITRGCNPPRNDRFCPSDPVRRDEMASFLARARDLAPIQVPPRPSVSLAFTGDVLIHPQVWRQAAVYGRPYDFRPMFAPVKETIHAADLALCHLEVPLARDNQDLSGYPTFYSPRQVADALAWAGYDGCSTASNHSFDQGEEGIASTVEVMAAAGLAQAGMAARPGDAKGATRYRVGEAVVAHLSATWWLNGFRLPADKPWLVQLLEVDDLLDQAARARREGADVVVVSVHCCVEYQTEPTDYQRAVARRLIASPDVDLVVGHHAHVVQPVEEIDGEYVVYGVGNFLSAQRLRPATQDGVVVEVDFALRDGRWRARGLEAYPTWVEADTYAILPAAVYNSSSWLRTRRAVTSYGAAGVTVIR